MAFFKPLMYLLPARGAQCALHVNIRHGDFKNCFTLLNNKIIFRTEIIRSIKTRHKNSKSSISKRHLPPPENVGVKFEDMGNHPLTMSILWKPFLFTTAFSAATFAVCAIWQYENMRRKTLSFMKSPSLWNPNGHFWESKKRFSWREELNRLWNQMRDSEKLFSFICLANVLVHLAWKVKKFDSTMVKYFCTTPTSSALCWPLVLSTFSHYNTVHLLMNMYALHSFSLLAIDSLGKEQFIGLYLAGGAVSSFASLFFKVLFKRPGLSVGASGAILAVVGYISARHPNLEFSIIGLPMFTFTARSAVITLMGLDVVGLMLGWKFFDHAAHLGGVCAGMFWYYYGNANIWQKREPLLHWWRELRDSAK